jgi:hypothetical protein
MKMWEELDRLTTLLKRPEGNENAIQLSAQALGVANCIAYFYPSDKGVNWVRQEAMARWAAKYR